MSTWEHRDKEPAGCGFTALAALAVYVLLLVVFLPLIDGDTAYEAGRLIVPVLVTSLIVGVVARSQGGLAWWIQSLSVLLGSLLLASLLVLTSAVSDTSSKLRYDPVVRELRTVETAADGWHLRTTGGADKRAESFARSLGDEAGPADPVYGEYERGPATRVFFAVNSHVGSEFAGEIRDDPDGNLREFMAGADLSDVESFPPGRLGGRLSCGRGELNGVPVTACGWTEDASLAMLLFLSATDAPDLDEAAAATRDFRPDVTSSVD